MADIPDLQDGTSGKDKLVEGEDVQQTGSTEVAEGGAAEESQTEPVLEPEAGSVAPASAESVATEVVAPPRIRVSSRSSGGL